MKTRSIITTILTFVLFIVALWLLRKEMRGHHLDEVFTAITSISWMHVVIAMGMVILCYICFCGYDILGLELLRKHVKFRRVALTSFLSYSLANSLGLSAVTAGSMRLHLYEKDGVSGTEVFALTAYGTLTSWLGFVTMGSLALLLAPPNIAAVFPVPPETGRVIGAFGLGILTAYLALSVVGEARIYRIRGWEFRCPTLLETLLQILLGSMETTLLAGTLYALLPQTAEPLVFLTFIGIFLMAHVAGLVSQIPGGVGVMETVLVHTLSPWIDAPQALGALLLYRIVYNGIPLILGGAVLLLYELRVHHHRLWQIKKLVFKSLPPPR